MPVSPLAARATQQNIATNASLCGEGQQLHREHSRCSRGAVASSQRRQQKERHTHCSQPAARTIWWGCGPTLARRSQRRALCTAAGCSPSTWRRRSATHAAHTASSCDAHTQTNNCAHTHGISRRTHIAAECIRLLHANSAWERRWHGRGGSSGRAGAGDKQAHNTHRPAANMPTHAAHAYAATPPAAPPAPTLLHRPSHHCDIATASHAAATPQRPHTHSCRMRILLVATPDQQLASTAGNSAATPPPRPLT